MAQVKKGSKVKVFYTGKLKDGTVFESNLGQQPLEFVVGKGKVIKGFEKAVLDMNLGQSRTVTMKPADAYGPRDPQLVVTVASAALPQGLTPELNGELACTLADGREIDGIVTAIGADTITVDGNHPLAGKNLTFDIKLVGIG
jgi:peptidylprolyl isomerase